MRLWQITGEGWWRTVYHGAHSHYRPKRFCTNVVLYQYDIHIIVLHENVLYNNHLLHVVQSGGWICTVSVKTGHCALCSGDLNERPVASVHSALVVLLSPAQVYEPCIELTFQLGEKGLIRDNSFETMVQPAFHYTIFLYVSMLFLYTFTLQFFVLVRSYESHSKLCEWLNNALKATR